MWVLPPKVLPLFSKKQKILAFGEDTLTKMKGLKGKSDQAVQAETPMTARSESALPCQPPC
jgi:hypothetical protein